MPLRVNKYMLSIVSQKKYQQFYFQIDYSKKFILHRILKIKIKAGIETATHIHTGKNYEEWDECEMIGLFFDITICGIRLGWYVFPISYKKHKDKKKIK